MEGRPRAGVAVDIRFKNNAQKGHVHILHQGPSGPLTKTVELSNGAAALLSQFVATALLLLSNPASNSGSNSQAH